MDWGYLLASAGAIGGIFKSIGTTIQEGELGCRTTFGKVGRHKKGELRGKIKVMSPTRLPFVIPFVQRIEKVHIKNNTTNLPNMQITLKNSLSYTFDAYMDYDILTEADSIETVLFTMEDWEEWITLRFKVAIQSTLYGYDETPEKMREVWGDVQKELEKLVKHKNCFKINHCGITNLSETPTSQASRSVDYRIAAAMEHLKTDKLPECVLAAALGSTPVVSPSDCASFVLEPEELVE